MLETLYPSLDSLVLIFFRALGMASIWPFISGSRSLGPRLTLAIALSIGTLPLSTNYQLSSYHFLALEFLIGLGLILPAALAVHALDMLAELIDTGRGQSIANFYDAETKVSRAVLSEIIGKLFWLKLLFLGIFEKLMLEFGKSLQGIPCGSSSFEDLSSFGANLFGHSLLILSGLSLLYLPFAALNLVIEIAIGFCSKLMPQVNLFAEAFLIKTIFQLVFLLLLYKANDWSRILGAVLSLDLFS